MYYHRPTFIRAEISTVGFEVPTAMVMKNFIFWDMMSCSLVKVNRNFGGTCRLYLQG
jgi:hypothetical protein